MKKFIILVVACSSMNAYSMTLTKEFLTTSLKFNEEKKYYETTFVLMAGIYKANEKDFKCLQKSLETKLSARVTYEPMGLKVTKCENH